MAGYRPGPGGLALILLLFAPLPVRGELAVLAGGHVLQIDAYLLQGDRMRLDLRGGGSLTVPLSRLERIVDDEIVEAPEALPAPVLDLAFDERAEVPTTPYGELFHEVARRHGLNAHLLAAIARAESAFDPRAVSHKGARGLLQLMPATAERFGVSDHELFDPVRNVEAGARYLAWLVRTFERDPVKVLAAYNAGEGAVRRYAGVPPYRETQGYVRRVLGYLGIEAASSVES